jgi:hypothetical protein
MNELTIAAASYINAGLRVLALSGKLPNTALHPRGVHSAVGGTMETEDDMDELSALFEHSETTGVGIAIPKHLAVVDIDGEDGAVTWQRLVDDPFSSLAIVPVAKTGRGLHLWFSSLLDSKNAKLGPKLDIKGAGGYVAAPPSQHFNEDGEPDYVYTWLRHLVGPDGKLALREELPRSIAELMRPLEEDFGLGVGPNRDRGSITGLVRSVRYAEEGNRNDMLAWAAMTARDTGFTFEETAPKLTKAALENGLTPEETRATLRSAFRKRGR